MYIYIYIYIHAYIYIIYAVASGAGAVLCRGVGQTQTHQTTTQAINKPRTVNTTIRRQALRRCVGLARCQPTDSL